MARLALGFRVHTGWAVSIALTGSRHNPEVIDRRVVELFDPAARLPEQVYHAAAGRPEEVAADMVRRAKESATTAAKASIAALVKEISNATPGEIVGAAVLRAKGKLSPSLEAILASHAQMHLGEGDLFRDALTLGCEDAGIPVTAIVEKRLESEAQEELGLPAETLTARVRALGRPLGPPWAQDQRHAALAAWVVLAGTT